MSNFSTPVKEEQQAELNPSEANLFAKLLESYEPVLPRRGQYLTGRILSVDNNMILADVGAKRTAIVPPQDIALIEEEQLEQLDSGAEVTLFVTRTPRGEEPLEVSLRRGLQYEDWQLAEKLLAEQDIVTLPVIGFNRGGIEVQFQRLRGFVPNSHVPQLLHIFDNEARKRAKARLVGETLSLKIIEVDSQRRRLVLSGKHAAEAQRQQRLLELKAREGESVTGRVTKLVKFGAFVDLVGVQGLLHISEIAWHKVEDPADVLQEGQELDLQILNVDLAKDRVGLSRKSLLPNPYETFATDHQIGELVEATITNTVDFGAFVLLTPGVEGLIHISEMTIPQGVDPAEVINPGETVLARLVSLEPERERIGLSQRQVSQTEELEWTWQKAQATAA